MLTDSQWGFLAEVEFVGRPAAPNVSNIAVDGLTWTAAAHSINQVTLTFDEHVTIAAGQATLTDQAGTDYTLFGPLMNPGSEPGTYTATWQTEAFLDIGRYTIKLDDGVIDDDGNPLDGEWTNNTSTASGDGAPGGDFTFTFNVLPGDVNQDGLVNFVDAIEGRNLVGTVMADPTYSALHDIVTRGSVQMIDVYAALVRSFDVLPPHPAASGAAVPELTGTEYAMMLAVVAVVCIVRRRVRSN